MMVAFSVTTGDLVWVVRGKELRASGMKRKNQLPASSLARRMPQAGRSFSARDRRPLPSLV